MAENESRTGTNFFLRQSLKLVARLAPACSSFSEGMSDSIGNGPFNHPDYDQLEDEGFPPLPPPLSPGLEGDDPFGDGDEDGGLSKLEEVPTAKRRTVKRPQPKLDSQRLISERGLPALRTLFDNVSFKGKGHEAEDLRLVMQKMENWAHRLYPKLQFDDFMNKVEKLGSKKDVQTCLKRIRLDMPLIHEDFIGEKEVTPVQHVFEDPDPFGSTGSFPLDSQGPVHSTPAPTLTDEQQRRIKLNKQLALERRLARKQPPTDLPDSISAQTDSSQDISAQAGVQASSVHLPPAISPPTEPCPLKPGLEEREDMDVSTSTEPPENAKVHHLDPA